MIVKNVEKKETNSVFFQVDVDAAEFEAAVNKAYLQNKGQIYIPGFRKGKAPRAVIEGMYGKEVFYQDAVDALGPQAFEYGVIESDLKLVGIPAIEDVNIGEDKTVSFTFSATTYPEVTLGQYKGLEVVKGRPNVTEREINAELESVRKNNSRKITVDDRAAEMGDVANIDFDGFLDGERFDGGKAEGYELELGSKEFVPGFEEQVVGMQIGEEKDVNITFPEDYAEHLAGKAVVFKVKLNSLSVNELPELDDEFAKDVSEFDTLEEYKADLASEIEKRYVQQIESKFRSDVIELACENMTVEIPEVMITDRMENMLRNYAANFGMKQEDLSLEQIASMMGIDPTTMDITVRPAAEAQVKTDLLIEAVIKAEGIEVTDEDAEEALNKIAESINAKPEEIKQYFEPAYLKAERAKELATELLLNSAVVTEAAEEKAE